MEKEMSKEKITVAEFKAWLEGLVFGKRGALPDLEDWKMIKQMVDRIKEQPVEDKSYPSVDWDLIKKITEDNKKVKNPWDPSQIRPYPSSPVSPYAPTLWWTGDNTGKTPQFATGTPHSDWYNVTTQTCIDSTNTYTSIESESVLEELHIDEYLQNLVNKKIKQYNEDKE